ncbi:hypothetical protein ASD59_01520 [Brevundimonas sp. Root608]|nr:hypothetical protein ASD59_01520 [Brevundimonas sp. Root608]
MFMQQRHDRPVACIADDGQIAQTVEVSPHAATHVPVRQAPTADAQRHASSADAGLDVCVCEKLFDQSVRNAALVSADGCVVGQLKSHDFLPCWLRSTR